VKGSFYGELELTFDKFPKYHEKIVLDYFNAKAGKENILSQQLGMKVYRKLVTAMELN
jgi:hypothetical protein